MAPEQINGQAADARSDVFAFGVVMYEFACGAHPFEATTELARLARVLDSDARPLDDRCPHLPPAMADIIERCLRKPPAERFASAAEVVSAIGRYSERPLRRRHLTWWRTHQVAVMALYVVAATIAWGIKETYGGRVALWLFVLLGITGAIAGIVRGHLLFTERFNQLHLGSERRRTARAVRAADLVIAAGLLADGLEVAPIKPLWGVLTMAVAVGIGLAAVLMEPATTDAAFGDQRT